MMKFFIAAVLLAVGAAGLYWLMSPSALDAECAAYVDDAAVAISAHWSRGELLSRATPNLAQYMSVKSKEFDSFFENASTGLGPLRRYEGTTGGGMGSHQPGTDGHRARDGGRDGRDPHNCFILFPRPVSERRRNTAAP